MQKILPFDEFDHACQNERLIRYEEMRITLAERDQRIAELERLTDALNNESNEREARCIELEGGNERLRERIADLEAEVEGLKGALIKALYGDSHFFDAINRFHDEARNNPTVADLVRVAMAAAGEAKS